jgi:asparagine synthase (glutamine-hydrolysing)
VPYEDYSELPAARITAQRCQTEHFEETIYPSLVRILPDLVWHLDEPSDPLSVLSYYIARMARREVKVVLGGDGGDELFGGYDRYYGQRFVNYYATLLPAPVRRHFISQILRFLPDGFWYKSFSHKLKWMNQLSLSPRGGQRYAQSLNYFYFSDQYRETLYGDRLTHRLNGHDALETIYAWFDCDNAEDFVDKMLFADSMVRLPDHPVMILDRMTMAHGLEARAPFMDHKLAEFAARIPASLKVKGRTLRYIQHRLAERYLAPELLKRKKQGFSSALPYLLADEFQYLFDEFLSDSHLVREGYLADEPIQKLLLEHRNRKVDHGNRLWLLCNAEIWYRMAIEEEPRETMKAQLMQYAGTAESPSMEPERL